MDEALETITCSVEVGRGWYPYSIDRGLLEAKMTKEATKTLLRSGFKVVEVERTATGLGAGGSLIGILLMIWKYKDLLALFRVLVDLATKTTEHWLNYKYSKKKLKVCVRLYISSDKYITLPVEYDDLKHRLNIMALAAITESSRLSKQYPVFEFTTSVEVHIRNSGFSAVYKGAGLSKINNQRIIGRISHLKFVPGHNIEVQMLDGGWMKECVTSYAEMVDSTVHTHDWRYIKLGRTFFTKISDNILFGYPSRVRRMKFADYNARYINGRHMLY
jgi:hypothetical protein